MSAGGGPGSRGGPRRSAGRGSDGARYRCADRRRPWRHHADARVRCVDRGSAAGRRDVGAA